MALQATQKEYTPLEAVFFTGFKGLAAGEKQAWQARFFLGAKKKEGAKAAKAVARPTDRVSTVAEEMGQAAGWALSAERVGQTVPVIRQCRLQHSHLLRCIFGNPFHPMIIDPGVLIPKVVGLAHTIYEGRVFDRMPELGEALEQSGCTNTDILAHCRGPGATRPGLLGRGLVAGQELNPAVFGLAGNFSWRPELQGVTASPASCG
jgi:hypothetical protein